MAAKKSIWGDEHRPYGVNKGPRGNPDQWKRFFEQAMGMDEAQSIVGSESSWAILGIERGSDAYAIKKAFRDLAFKTHPDYGGTEAAFRRVYAAYTMLMEGE
jgi:DnaJ-class molecular chaperone